MVLSAFGFSTKEATSAPEALRLVGECAPDAVLCDVQMPGGDGFALLEGMRAWPHVPVILMTGEPNTRDRARALAQGAAAYLSKTLPTEDLVAVVGNAIAQAFN